MTVDAATDILMREVAVQHLERLGARRVLTSQDLAAGFVFQGERVLRDDLDEIARQSG